MVRWGRAGWGGAGKEKLKDTLKFLEQLWGQRCVFERNDGGDPTQCRKCN